MTHISKELSAVLSKVGPVSGSHVVISGQPYGVHVDVTNDDLQVIVDEIASMKILTAPGARITSLEIMKVLNDAESTRRFMFCCCLLQNAYKSPLFTIQPEGNYDRLNFQGQVSDGRITNAVFPEESKRKESKATAPASTPAAKKTRGSDKGKEVTKGKAKETKPRSIRKKGK